MNPNPATPPHKTIAARLEPTSGNGVNPMSCSAMNWPPSPASVFFHVNEMDVTAVVPKVIVALPPPEVLALAAVPVIRKFVPLPVTWFALEPVTEIGATTAPPLVRPVMFEIWSMNEPAVLSMSQSVNEAFVTEAVKVIVM